MHSHRSIHRNIRWALFAGLVYSAALAPASRAAVDEEFLRLVGDAEAGRATAQYYLGLRYLHGVGIEKDEAAAASWFEKSAAGGEPAAAFNFGRMLREGRLVRRDPVRAARLLGIAAQYGIAGAKVELGELLLVGEGVPKDYATAAGLFREASALGNAIAAFNLGVMHARGWGFPADKAAARRWYEVAAERGEPNAQFNVAAAILAGDPSSLELQKALTLLQQAAGEGVAAAEFTLGRLYEEGRGVAMNELRAAQWYRLAAARGHAPAMSNLGRLLIRREPGKDGDAEAIRLLVEASAQLEPSALFNLGMLREYGVGVERDPVRAAEEIRQAAWLGFGPAQMKMAILCLTDVFGAPNATDAAAWRTLAVEQRSTVPGANVLDGLSAEAVSAGRNRAVEIDSEIERTRSLRESGVDAATVLLQRVRPPRARANGFVIAPDGLVVTGYSAIAAAGELKVRTEGKLAPARLLAIDETRDLAILTVAGNFEHWLGRATAGPTSSAVLRAPIPVAEEGATTRSRWLDMKMAVAATPFGDDAWIALSETWDPEQAGLPLLDEAGGVAGMLSLRRTQTQGRLGITSDRAGEFGMAVRTAAILRMIEDAGRRWPEAPISTWDASGPEAIRSLVTIIGF